MQDETNAPRTPVVLLVEDNPDHVFLATLAIEDAGVGAELHHVGDGEAAMLFLRRQGAYAAAPKPDLIFLDINLPRVSGFEVMQAVHDDPALRALPVTVLTTSANPADEQRMRDLGCTHFLCKPHGFGELGPLVLQSVGRGEGR